MGDMGGDFASSFKRNVVITYVTGVLNLSQLKESAKFLLDLKQICTQFFLCKYSYYILIFST